MKIGTNNNKATPGDFSAIVEDEQIFIPVSIWNFLKEQRLTNLEDFVSHVISFPSAWAFHLNWNVTDVIKAGESLVEQLHGKLPERFTKPAPQRAFGAVESPLPTYQANEFRFFYGCMLLAHVHGGSYKDDVISIDLNDDQGYIVIDRKKNGNPVIYAKTPDHSTIFRSHGEKGCLYKHVANLVRNEMWSLVEGDGYDSD